jgi:cytochrome c5
MTRRVLLVSFLALAACRAVGEKQAGAAADSGGARSMGEQRILRAAMLAAPQAGVNPDSLPDRNSAGAKVLVQYCTQCHALPSPAGHGAQDWPFVARQMWLFIDHMQGELGVQSPSTAERAQLLSYLQAHALEVASSLPPGAGKETFRATCSRCHVLPDPRRHSPVDWPTVVMRMERNMERFRLSGVTHGMAEQIVGYLRMASARK